MSYPGTTNGLRRQLEDWSQINWRKVFKIVKNLRQRIFLARKLGNWRKLRSLQKLMQRSYANLLLSVRKITQTNRGKRTAGIDKEIVNTPSARVKLVNGWKGGNQDPTRRVMIPKPNGQKRPLGIPTVRDRIEQAIIVNSLEPEWESVFEINSYGFRPGRSCHDAIAQAWVRLNAQPRTNTSRLRIFRGFSPTESQRFQYSREWGNHAIREVLSRGLEDILGF